uniref:SH2 domain-containing protein n=1 Tax=Rodentolepis nana TaxID=102285 RepID=A0A0R3TXA2_RODNA
LTLQFAHFSLNLETLNLPHADDSDASEKENEELQAESEIKSQVRILRPTSYVCSLNSKSAPPPPPPPKESPKQIQSTSSGSGHYRGPLGKSRSVDHTDAYEMENDASNGCSASETWKPLDSATLLNQLVLTLTPPNVDPLSDASMQGEVLNAVQRMQNGVYKESSPRNKPDFANSSPCCCNENGVENADRAPCCHAETKSDTEDDFEMIFANGKKYKRYFKRHIVFQKHVCRQVVVAPSLPDGSGPDLSRQVVQGPVQICRLENGTQLSPSKSKGQLSTLSNSGDFPSCSTSTLLRGDDSSSCSSNSFNNGKPPVVPTPPNATLSSANNTCSKAANLSTF